MILTLASEDFGGPLRSPGAKGVNPIFRGKVNVDGDDIHCYIKPIPDHVLVPNGKVFGSRELISEALGYGLAKACGHNVADVAGIIQLRLDQMPPSVRAAVVAQTPPSHQQDDYLAWFSQDMGRPSLLKLHVDLSAPQHMVNLQLRRIALALAEHPDSPALVTFDEWTQNSDRNLGNLLEAVGGKLILIDHGALFFSPLWEPAKLGLGAHSEVNRIKNLINTYSENWSEKTPNKSARQLAYNNLAVHWKSHGMTTAQQLLAEFLDGPEVDQVVAFLGNRLDPVKYNKVVGLLV